MWSSRNQMLTDNDGDDVAFLSGSGESRHGLYDQNAKRDLYERGHVAQCSRCQATCLTIFIFTTIFLSSLSLAFIRPFTTECVIDESEDNFLFGLTPNVVNDDDDDYEDLEDEEDFIATNGDTFPWEDIRLPTFIKPIRYDIELTPNLTTLWVKGIEKLIFAVTEETNYIVFHSKNITITSRTINERLKVEKMLEYPRRDQIYLETDEYMQPGVTYAIRIKFQYKLSDHLEGFYLSKYFDSEGEEHRLATSHFEPTYARRAFPCFDEPQMKARFLMTITHDREKVALFNTPKREVSEVRGRPNLVRDEFEESVEMSTYLVAFVVCDFTSVSKMSKKNVNVSVIASPDKIDQAQFALNAASTLLDYYDDYFNTAYPLEKLDLIAIPDFSAGAMENWGLITYRETSLLFSESQTSVIANQWIAVVVAHELAHQWFGNLVTMKWWNDIWLNEGFASWMEYRGVNYIHPEWQMMDQFFVDIVAPALELDSLTTSHPVSVEVKDPKEIEAIFDAISYKKGAAIIHMLEKMVGQETIRTGLSNYLKKHRFGNAVTGDLWQAISEAWNGTQRNFSIPEMMDTWTLQMGYPIIIFEQQNATNIYTIRQEKFFKASNVNETSINARRDEQNYDWIVPIDYASNLEDFSDTFILNKSQTIEIEFPADMRWFKANINGSGFYRVGYPRENWDALVNALIKDHKVFSVADRAQLINDAFSLSIAGFVNATVPLEMCTYLLKEDEYVPFSAAISHLNKWKQLLQETDLVGKINAFIRHLITPQYEEVGWEEKGSHMERMMRKLIIETAVTSRMKEAEDKAVGMFQNFMRKNMTVEPNFRFIAFTSGVRFGDVPEWKFAWRMFNTSRVPSNKMIWMRALASSQNTYFLRQYLDAALDPTRIRSQDVRTIVSEIATNPSGFVVAWRHFQMHWEQYLERFGSGSQNLGAIIEATTAHFSTEFDYRKVKAFFKSRRKFVGSGRRALDQSMEQILINTEWRETHEEDIKQWLESRVGTFLDYD